MKEHSIDGREMAKKAMKEHSIDGRFHQGRLKSIS